jgi:hypothetical protein
MKNIGVSLEEALEIRDDPARVLELKKKVDEFYKSLYHIDHA